MIQYKRTILSRFVGVCLPAFLMALLMLDGCEKNETRGGGELPRPDEAYIYLTVRSAGASINIDTELWEDRVEGLRMIVFDSADGRVVLNEKLNFPDGFNFACSPVKMRPNTYDFCFIANEEARAGDFVDALLGLTNRSELESDPRFANLGFDPAFIPDGTSLTGLFVMSAIYENISVVSGGTETNPDRLNLPDSRVELVRSLAKVEVVFRKQVAGSEIEDDAISSIRIDRMASLISVPPYDNYYTGATRSSGVASTEGFRFDRDSIGSVVFYIPELLVPQNGTNFSALNIDDHLFPIRTLDNMEGLAEQRRTVPALSQNSVIRNYHYVINAYLNAAGGLDIEMEVQPWKTAKYTYIFEDDLSIVLPPVEPTDSSIIIPTVCGTIELLSKNEKLQSGLMGAYNDQISYWPEGIIPGSPPYYCEKLYGPEWRLINACELMSFIVLLDEAYRVWTSNTWNADSKKIPVYPKRMRIEAQKQLEKLTGLDLSASVYQDTANRGDKLANSGSLTGMYYAYFVPGDIMERVSDYPGGWPFSAPSKATEAWIYNEVTIQLLPYYDTAYISPLDRDDWDRILYREFNQYNHYSTTSRCVRVID